MSSDYDWSFPLQQQLLDLLVDVTRGDCPEVLWHYTGVEAYTRIATAGEFWATDYDYLNDPDEARLLWDELEQFCRASNYFKPLHTSFDVAESLTWCLHEPELHVRNNPGEFRPFVACFSEARDSLGQWRLYGRDGLGCAVGVAAECLDARPRTSAGTTTQSWLFSRVIYDRERARRNGLRYDCRVLAKMPGWRIGPQ